MSMTGAYIVIAAIVGAFLSFAGAVLNMFFGTIERRTGESVIAVHLVSMLGMAFSTMVGLIGLIWLAIDAQAFYG